MTHPKDTIRMKAKKRRAAAKVRRAHKKELVEYYESIKETRERYEHIERAYDNWTLPH